MDVYIKPSTAYGTITAPPSKSLAHRYIICAALAKGRSIIDNVDLSEDIKATLDCVKALGVGVLIEKERVTIDGINPNEALFVKNGGINEELSFYCRESGSTMRFFMGLAMYFGKPSRFYGSVTLRNRPFGIYEDICDKQGIDFVRNEDHIYVNGRLSAGIYELKGNISSQFITGLMFGLPLLEEDSTIKLIPPVESRSYINLTIQALRDYGVDVHWSDDTTLFIKGGQSYKACDRRVEGDCSNAAFLEAFNYIGGDVKVLGLNEDTLQGDGVYKKLFDILAKGDDITIDISDCPDLGPILFALAACLKGGSFTGTRRLRMKESDRGSVMCAELAKLGISSVIEENDIHISGADLVNAKDVSGYLHGEDLSGHNDHRIVMSLSLILTLLGGKITGANAVAKSYPGFFEDIEGLGIKLERI